jgi:hypothetical protein
MLPLAQDERVKLADPAELDAVGGHDGRRAAGVQEGPRAAPALLHAPVANPGRLHQPLEQRLHGVEVGRARGRAPALRRRLGEEGAEAVVLVGWGLAAGRPLRRGLEHARREVRVSGLE